MSWRLKFQKAVIYHLGAVNSDHSPLLLNTNPCESYAPRPFRFKAAWIRDRSCFQLLRWHGKENVWGQIVSNYTENNITLKWLLEYGTMSLLD
jgi:hypothetical protein